MTETALATGDYFTWEDYRTWPDSERWEIIGGEVFAMSPAPSLRHQTISVELAAQFNPEERIERVREVRPPYGKQGRQVS